MDFDIKKIYPSTKTHLETLSVLGNNSIDLLSALYLMDKFVNKRHLYSDEFLAEEMTEIMKKYEETQNSDQETS